MSLWKLLTGRWGSGAGETDEIEIDAATNTINTISYTHHEIHGGSGFRCISNKDVTNGGTYTIAFTTPNTTSWVHMTFTVEHEQEAELVFMENVTAFSSGTTAVVLNSDRNSLVTSGIIDMATDVGITSGSPVILIHEVGGSGKKFGDSSEHDHEWLLKQNTKYFMRLTDQSASGNNETNLILDWYEHSSKH